MSASETGGTQEAVRKLSLPQACRAVAWSFFGVRRSSDVAQDLARLKPLQVVVVGILAAALFVLVLVALVQWVVGSGVAG